MSTETLPIGTRIRFTATLTAPANEDHPPLLFARAGDCGEITGHNCHEGHLAKTDHWPNSFGVSRSEFEPITP